jgi:hypothetical protein
MLNDEFFPTPPKLISRLLADIDFNEVEAILEPSAGKGDLAARAAKLVALARSRRVRYAPEDDGKDIIDCVEIDPDLCNALRGGGFRVVHDDFLTYQTRKHYDLIIMNPPFSAGAKHLLKALELVEYGGQVRCVLNAETIRNPYSFERRLLIEKLKAHDADITFLVGEFSHAERPTDVEVALISVKIPNSLPDSIILSDLHEAQKAKAANENAQTDIVPGDFVDAIVARYRFEVEAGVRLIHEYERIRPHLLDKLAGDYRNPILQLTIDENKLKCGSEQMLNGYVRLTRLKYWQALFEAPQFIGQLTSNLQQELVAKVEKLGDYEFSRVNILSIQRDMSQHTIASIENTILKQFDELSRLHSWDKDSSNVHYFNGWCTNKSWKINDKVILPNHSWDTIWHRWDYSRSARDLTDLEKCLSFLNRGLPPEISISQAMTRAKDQQQSSGIESSFFSVTFYKKGTCHIKFTRKDLLDRLNIFGAQRKHWLPPNYGKSRYTDMDATERAAVDSFQGELDYAKVMEDPDRYIIEPTGMLQLVGLAEEPTGTDN